MFVQVIQISLSIILLTYISEAVPKPKPEDKDDLNLREDEQRTKDDQDLSGSTITASDNEGIASQNVQHWTYYNFQNGAAQGPNNIHLNQQDLKGYNPQSIWISEETPTQQEGSLTQDEKQVGSNRLPKKYDKEADRSNTFETSRKRTYFNENHVQNDYDFDDTALDEQDVQNLGDFGAKIFTKIKKSKSNSKQTDAGNSNKQDLKRKKKPSKLIEKTKDLVNGHDVLTINQAATIGFTIPPTNPAFVVDVLDGVQLIQTNTEADFSNFHGNPDQSSIVSVIPRQTPLYPNAEEQNYNYQQKQTNYPTIDELNYKYQQKPTEVSVSPNVEDLNYKYQQNQTQGHPIVEEQNYNYEQKQTNYSTVDELNYKYQPKPTENYSNIDELNYQYQQNQTQDHPNVDDSNYKHQQKQTEDNIYKGSKNKETIAITSPKYEDGPTTEKKIINLSKNPIVVPDFESTATTEKQELQSVGTELSHVFEEDTEQQPSKNTSKPEGSVDQEVSITTKSERSHVVSPIAEALKGSNFTKHKLSGFKDANSNVVVEVQRSVPVYLGSVTKYIRQPESSLNVVSSASISNKTSKHHNNEDFGTTSSKQLQSQVVSFKKSTSNELEPKNPSSNKQKTSSSAYADQQEVRQVYSGKPHFEYESFPIKPIINKGNVSYPVSHLPVNNGTFQFEVIAIPPSLPPVQLPLNINTNVTNDFVLLPLEEMVNTQIAPINTELNLQVPVPNPYLTSEVPQASVYNGNGKLNGNIKQSSDENKDLRNPYNFMSFTVQNLPLPTLPSKFPNIQLDRLPAFQHIQDQIPPVVINSQNPPQGAPNPLQIPVNQQFYFAPLEIFQPPPVIPPQGGPVPQHARLHESQRLPIIPLEYIQFQPPFKQQQKTFKKGRQSRGRVSNQHLRRPKTFSFKAQINHGYVENAPKDQQTVSSDQPKVYSNLQSVPAEKHKIYSNIQPAPASAEQQKAYAHLQSILADQQKMYSNGQYLSDQLKSNSNAELPPDQLKRPANDQLVPSDQQKAYSNSPSAPSNLPEGSSNSQFNRYVGLEPPNSASDEYYSKNFRTNRNVRQNNFENVRMEYGFMPPLIPSIQIDENGKPIESSDA